jgi:hypothetical protein
MTLSLTLAEPERRAPREAWIMRRDRARPGVERLVAVAGSVERAAQLANVTTATIYRWRSDWKGGGLRGAVPSGRVRVILINARDAGLALSRADLVEE